MSHAWTSGDRDGVKRLIACGLTFYAAMAALQMVILLAIAYFGLPLKFQGESRRLIVWTSLDPGALARFLRTIDRGVERASGSATV